MEFNREPQCKTCIEPLNPSNREALDIWLITESQLIVASGGMGAPQVVGLNHLAVWEMIDRYGVKDQTGTFEKVLRLFNEISMPGFQPEG